MRRTEENVEKQTFFSLLYITYPSVCLVHLYITYSSVCLLQAFGMLLNALLVKCSSLCSGCACFLGVHKPVYLLSIHACLYYCVYTIEKI